MLSPIHKPATKRDFITFDLEWAKGERYGNHWHPKVTLAGVYDGNRYRYYYTIREFLEGELTHKNRGKWFYAHAGGLADMIFVLEILLKNPSYQVDASFSGSSAIIVRIKRGKAKWVFVDSYWLLRDKLANIAKFVGMEKGEVDFESETLQSLIDYNELDCKILWHAIDRFQETLLGLGGQLQMTLASSSMALFRRRYLKRHIIPSPKLNDATRHSYVASRVEIFQKECGEALYYDINSSFPFAMTFEAPGNPLRTRKDLPSHNLYLCQATVTVPDMYFPPLPYRHEHKVYFPTGTWKGWFMGTDMQLLEERGGRIETVHTCIEFLPFNDLRDFALDLYEMRKNANDAMSKMVLKLLLNSLYGKFGESESKTSLICYPDEPLRDEGASLLFPGVYLLEREVEVPHGHVPLAAHITSIARKVLYEFMDRTDSFYYCDTDGFACNGFLETGSELGQLKKELEIKRGKFYRPKVYELEHADGKRVKAKGFTLTPDNQLRMSWPVEERDRLAKEYSYEQFARLVDGHEVETRRFYRIRELLRKQGMEYQPTETIVPKRLQRETPKRCFGKNGDSRPWTVEEIGE